MDKFDSSGSVKNEIIPVQEFCKELRQPNIRKFKKLKCTLISYRYIWGADLANMQLKGKFNEGIRFLLYVIDIFSNYA